jgi:demethylmenaquinone methyltransferase/2-methoxy-6-polyprenyl-1,4-benzoquinol methylase
MLHGQAEPAFGLRAASQPRKLKRMSTTELEQRTALEAAAGGREKRAYVRRIFSEIAPRYDLLNHILSVNIDRGWRRTAIEALDWPRDPTGLYVDLCAGTLDVSLALARQSGFAGRVIGADFAEPMLLRGLAKRDGARVSPVLADALQLPLGDAAASGVIVAFGVRNFADLDAGLREARRILAPGGKCVILEFSRPSSAIVRLGYRVYSRAILPAIGRLVSGHPTAYRYLPESVARFPTGTALAERMRAAGFIDVSWQPLTGGIAAVHVGGAE